MWSAFDWSVVRIYPCGLRPIGYGLGPGLWWPLVGGAGVIDAANAAVKNANCEVYIVTTKQVRDEATPYLNHDPPL